MEELKEIDAVTKGSLKSRGNKCFIAAETWPIAREAEAAQAKTSHARLVGVVAQAEASVENAQKIFAV